MPTSWRERVRQSRSASTAYRGTLAGAHPAGKSAVAARAPRDGDAARDDGRLGNMGSNLLAARRLLRGARRRRRGRRRGRFLRRERVRYALPAGSKLGLALPPRRQTPRRTRPRSIGRPVRLEPPRPGARGAPRVNGRADPAEDHHDPTPHAPTEPPVHNAAAPSRRGWTPAATGDTLSIGRRVACAPAAKARVLHHPGLHLLRPTRSTSSAPSPAATTGADHRARTSSDSRARRLAVTSGSGRCRLRALLPAWPITRAVAAGEALHLVA